MKEPIGYLSKDEYFLYCGRRYKVGELMDEPAGYVACYTDDGKTVRFHIDTVVERLSKEND